MTAKKDKALLTTDDQIRAEEAERKETEKEAALMEMKAEAEREPAEAGSFVYCGPSIRGVARQFTVFNGGLPETVKDFTDKHPLVRALIVPVDRFAEMRRKLETKGTAEALIFAKLKLEL